MTYKAGDQIVLRSGGPVMTILKVYVNTFADLIDAGWFDARGEYKTSSFPVAAVRPVKE